MLAQHPRPQLTKIPGELPKCPAEQHIQDLSKLTQIELMEIKERQEKLLANKFRISKLPDKARKVQNFYDKILKELEHRHQIENAANLFSDLNIASNGQKKITNLEWTGSCESSSRNDLILDSDDDENEINPLKIIAQSTNLEKTIKYLPPDKSLVTEEDLKEIESFKNINEMKDNKNVVPVEITNVDVSMKMNAIKPIVENKINEIEAEISKTSSTNSLDLDPHVLYLFEKSVDEIPKREKFKPFKTTTSNVHDPEKEKTRKLFGKNWEITAATPPPIKHSGTKVLSLQHSVELQVDYRAKLKELQEKQAEERLKAKVERLKITGIELPNENMKNLNESFGVYRSALKDEDSETESETAEYVVESDDEGVRDDEEEKGGITYVVYK